MLWIVSFIFYAFFQLLFLPIVIPYTFIKNIQASDTTTIVAEQTGFIPASDTSKNVIWIHGLSAGEISSTQELVSEIKRNVANAACYITSGTEEGKKTAQQQLNPDYTSLIPHDDPVAMALAFSRINPKAIIVLEHEVKPTMVMLARLKSIPVYLLNAQYTSNTVKSLESYGFLYRSVFNSFHTIFVQSENDKAAFQKAGIVTDTMHAIGNIKAYNVLPKKEALAPKIDGFLSHYKKQKNKPTIMLVGSVHKGEVDHYLKLFAELKPKNPQLKMILAPRYFDWKNELKQKLEKTGYETTVFDDATSCPNEPEQLLEFITKKLLLQNDIVAICLLGKLFAMYPLADLFFLGGTFLPPVGGHNLLEPAAWSNPTILGPCYQNTKDIADELKAHDAVIQVQNEQELIEQARILLKDEPKRIAMGARAGQWLAQEADRVRMNVQMLLDDLKKLVSDSQ